MEKKTLAIIILLMLLLPIITLLFNFRLLVFNEPFYKTEFIKNKVYDSLPAENVEQINKDVLVYIKNGGALENAFFNKKEKEHMADVKNLIHSALSLFYILLIIFAILFSILIFFTKEAVKTIKYLSIVFILGSALTIVSFFIIWILIKTDFSSFFTGFHELFFKPGTWVFSPGDKIYLLYPERFFFDAGVKLVFNTIFSSIILLITGAIMLYKQRTIID